MFGRSSFVILWGDPPLKPSLTPQPWTCVSLTKQRKSDWQLAQEEDHVGEAG